LEIREQRIFSESIVLSHASAKMYLSSTNENEEQLKPELQQQVH
jgi:hypothetical protein